MKEINAIKRYAEKHSIPIMKEDGMHFLLAYIQDHPDIMKVLEIGTAVGLSAIKMASVRENITIDTLEIDEAMVEQAKQNIAKMHMEDRIFVYHMDAMEFETAKYYDLYFVDAAKSQYHQYLEHFLPTSYVGSTFLFDNLNFHGIVDDPTLSHNRSTLQMTRKIKKFRDTLLNDKRFETIFYPEIGDGIAVARRIQ